MPITLLSILVIFIFTSKYFVLERLSPIFGNGVPQVFLNGLTNLFSFSGLGYLFFLMPLLKDTKDFNKICITGLILSSIFLFLSVVSLLLSFAFISQTEELLSLFLISRLVEFGSFFKRTDALFIFLWMLSFISYLSINTFFMTYIFKKLTNIQNQKAIIFPVSILLVGISRAYETVPDIIQFDQNFYKYYLLVIVFILSTIILILAYLKKSRKEKVGEVVKNE